MTWCSVLRGVEAMKKDASVGNGEAVDAITPGASAIVSIERNRGIG
jgi:hypothetical protein